MAARGSRWSRSNPPPAQVPPRAVRFIDCDTHEIVVAGAAQGMRYRCDSAIATSQHHWRAGDTIACEALVQARHVHWVEQTLLLLQLTRAPRRPRPTRDLQLSDGALLREVSGDKRASEQVMALGLLGALGSDPAPLVRFARDPENDREARWEALRQVLGLDSARGFALLDELAGEGASPLAGAAVQLRDQLAAAHPKLRELAEAR